MTSADMLQLFDHDQVLQGGFHLPTRMTALPLEDGTLALVSPIPIDDRLARELSALGEVRFLIAPNLLHHLYLGDASERFPAAKVLAPRALRTKRPELRLDGALEDGLPDELARSLTALKIEGAPSVDEVVLFHHRTRTLVITDLVFNVVQPRGLLAHIVLFLVGCHGRLGQSRAWRMFVKDRALAAASARRVLALDFDTLVPAHGQVVRSDARAHLERVLRWMTTAAPKPSH